MVFENTSDKGTISRQAYSDKAGPTCRPITAFGAGIQGSFRSFCWFDTQQSCFLCDKRLKFPSCSSGCSSQRSFHNGNFLLRFFLKRTSTRKVFCVLFPMFKWRKHNSCRNETTNEYCWYFHWRQNPNLLSTLLCRWSKHGHSSSEIPDSIQQKFLVHHCWAMQESGFECFRFYQTQKGRGKTFWGEKKSFLHCMMCQTQMEAFLENTTQIVNLTLFTFTFQTSFGNVARSWRFSCGGFRCLQLPLVEVDVSLLKLQLHVGADGAQHRCRGMRRRNCRCRRCSSRLSRRVAPRRHARGRWCSHVIYNRKNYVVKQKSETPFRVCTTVKSESRAECSYSCWIQNRFSFYLILSSFAELWIVQIFSAALWNALFV